MSDTRLPCGVVRDLLPLYAEELTGPESAELVKKHLEECADCRQRLEELRQSEPPAKETPAPMNKLKKEIGKRRALAAALAALGVFVVLFALLGRATAEKPLGYRPDLLTVEGLTPYDPAAEPTFSGSVSTFTPEGWETAFPGQALLLTRNGQPSGVYTDFYLDEENGELTVYLQYFSTQAAIIVDDVAGGVQLERPGRDTRTDAFYPVPDRVIYGFGSEQVLLWGEEMNGGVQILPRLALAYYALAAAFGAAALGLAWLLFRKKRAGTALLQLWFAPLAWLLGQLFIKGFETTSVFFSRDLLLIAVEAAAFYVLLTLSRLRRKKG